MAQTNGASLFKDGLLEECILWLFDLVWGIHQRIKHDNNQIILDGYTQWVKHHARVDPTEKTADQIFDDHKDYNTYLKCRLQLEVYDKGRKLVPFLLYHWNNEEKSDFDLGLVVPNELHYERLNNIEELALCNHKSNKDMNDY